MCKVKVNYKFPNCGHPSPMRKVCFEPITWACKTLEDVRGQCGHTIRKECRQAVNTVECSFRPCVKLRSCGHPCINVCGKDCNLGECGGCEEVRKKELRKMQHRYSRNLIIVLYFVRLFDEFSRNRKCLRYQISNMLMGDTKNLVK